MESNRSSSSTLARTELAGQDGNSSTPSSPPRTIPRRLLGRLPATCRHCDGTGREPPALHVEFSNKGALRGEQAYMSDETGISTSMLSMIFSGERAPGLLTLIKIARYYRTTVDRVLKIPAIWRRVHQEKERE